MNKQDLLNGKEVIFNNERWCLENQKDSLVQADVSFSEHLDSFIIWFEGRIVSSTKTFKALEKKLSQLKLDWHLELKKW